MNVQSYVEWCELAGLYLGHASKYEQYRIYEKKISAAGLNTVIVSDFLTDNQTRVDIVNWRTFSVYEMEAQATERVEMTATALHAIGATRAANAVRTAKSQSPFEAFTNIDLSKPGQLREVMEQVKGGDLLKHFRENVAQTFPELAASMGLVSEVQQKAKAQEPAGEYEAREEIERLLEKYVASSRNELQRDVERYGDPRTEPGYTLEGRRRELELMSQQEAALAHQLAEVEKLREQLTAMKRKMDKARQSAKPSGTNLDSLQGKMLKLVKSNRRIPVEQRIPEFQQALDDAEAFISAHPEVFQKDLIGDSELTRQLLSFGSFEVESSYGETHVRFEQPAGFRADWVRFSLDLVYAGEKSKALEFLLPAVERLRQRFSILCDEWSEQIVEHFRNYEGQMHEFELEHYEQDAAGEVTQESILSHVGSGSLTLQALDDLGEQIHCVAFFSVDWDEEHGFETGWEDEPSVPDVLPEKTASTGAVRLVDIGRALTPDDMTHFERRMGIVLLDEYRQFLLENNGGTPSVGHLVLKNSGMTMPCDVERFYSITGATIDSAPADSLEGAIADARKQSFPATLLPIARVAATDPLGKPSNASLLLVLSGKKQGQILLFDTTSFLAAYASMPKEMMAQFAGQIIEMALTAAKSLPQLFEKLKAKPFVDVPDWLQMIRHNDVPGFVHWLDQGGKLTNTHHEYGSIQPFTVTDYLTREATTELLEVLLSRHEIKPKQIRDSWQKFLLTDIARFRQLMPVFPQSMWSSVLASPAVWDHPEIWEQLADAGVDFNAPVNDEGAPPIHMAVDCGKRDAVKWLMAHGADPLKEDRYRRNAFIYAERGPGYECLAILEGRDENPQPVGQAAPDAHGISQLWEAAEALPAGVDLSVSIQIQSPAVTRIEKAYGVDCHYRLTFGVRNVTVTFNDMRSARQDYLHAGDWPAFLFAPILQWPELTPLWETLEVREFDVQKAIKKRTYQGPVREDLVPAARSALEQAFDPQEAAARGIRLRK